MADPSAPRAEDEHLAALRLAAIIESAEDAIIAKTLDGVITSWNRGAEQLYGYTPDDVVGQPIDVLVPEDQPDEIPRILARLRRGERIKNYETRRVRKDGKVLDVSLTISPIRDTDGSIVGASTIARDITQRKRLEAELQQARDAALQASRLKSEFLASMSHEIRTPLNAVIGMSGLLLDTDLDPVQREYAETVRASGEVLLTVINDILDFSKIEAGKLDLEVVNVGIPSIVQDTAALVAEQARQKGLEVATAVDREMPSVVRGDPSRIRQILVNLASNAVKFTERGRVSIRAGLAGRTADGVEVRFEVSDTGIGIPPDRRVVELSAWVNGSNSRSRVAGAMPMPVSRTAN